MMNTIRMPAVAGMFYPDNRRELHTMVAEFLHAIATEDSTDSAYSTSSGDVANLPKAIIVPHAGYVYSGAIAASAYARIQVARDRIKRVVLIGPSHRVSFQGLAVSSARQFATPLGTIPVDYTAIDELLTLPQVQLLDKAHLREHSLEVQLPFLQTILNDFNLIPLVVGEANEHQVGEVLETIWGGAETLIVISSDLSHYHDYNTAKKMDKLTSQAIESLNPQDIHYEQACGRNPVNGLLYIAKQHGMRAKTVDLRNSGDTAGNKDHVVGYGAYIFH